MKSPNLKLQNMPGCTTACLWYPLAPISHSLQPQASLEEDLACSQEPRSKERVLIVRSWKKKQNTDSQAHNYLDFLQFNLLECFVQFIFSLVNPIAIGRIHNKNQPYELWTKKKYKYIPSLRRDYSTKYKKKKRMCPNLVFHYSNVSINS